MSSPAIHLPRIEDLPDDPAVLRAVLMQVLQALRQATGKIEELQQHLEQLARRLYGRSSEKLDPNQILMDALLIPALEQRQPAPGQSAAAGVKVEGHTRKHTPHGRGIFPETLRHEEIIVPVPEHERICPQTGKERPLIGYEITKKLDYRQPELIVKVYKREKRGSLSGAEEVGVAVAPPPEGPIDKGMLDNGLLAHIAVSKFVDHLPLYRLEKIFARMGVDLSRRTMGDNLLAASEPLSALSEWVGKKVLANPVVHHDDTPVDLLTEGTKSGRHVREARLWVGTVPARDGPWVYYQFTTTREGLHVERFFDSYLGTVISDDFAGYGRLDPQKVRRAACWAHARRKFFEAQGAYPVEAAEMLERIRLLYKLEASVQPDAAFDDQRLQMRRELAAPQLAQIKESLDLWAQRVLPKSPLGKAVFYARNNWSRLERYADDPRVPIDNNAAEQAIRPVALGRRNWLFMGSERGGRAAAVYMTLLATCKRAGVNPYEYLRDIFSRIMSHSSHRLEELLPGNWRPAA